LSQLQASPTPMTEVASKYLPWGAASFVTLGAIMAITTSLNPSLIVPSRLALIFVEDGLAPRWLGVVNRRTATPVRALSLNLAAGLVLLVSRQLALALNIAVFALVLLYFMHSVAFLMLPRWNPALNREITIGMPTWLQRAAAWVSVLAMGGLILVQISRDAQTLVSTSLSQRISDHSLTSLELALVWSAIGAAMYVWARSRRGAS
jgi:APA family basic amino acid/polyamine antiporter